MNARIRENTEVTTRLMTPDAAVAEGAMALFGEKYGEEVRVVSMGAAEGNKPAWSIELCGGTHVRRTGDIGLFRIVGEGAVAAGVRRIEAVTGAAAEAVVARHERRLAEAAGALRAAPGRGARSASPRCWRTAAGWSARSPICRRSWRPAAAAAEVEQIERRSHLPPRNLGEVPARDLKGLAEAIGKQIGPRRGGAGVHRRGQGEHRRRRVARPDRRGSTRSIWCARRRAAVGGKGGGGRPDMAQAGGPDAAQADAALAAVRAAIAA